jgi:RND family efflux transporter MFP subunit
VTRPEVQPQPTEVVAPLVRVVRVALETVQYRVSANGTVMPRTQSDLVPQVSGEVVWVSPSLASGGFFDAGEPLVRIDARDYEAALESARASVTRMRSELGRARTEQKRQRELAQRSVASQAKIDDAENAYRVAEAQLREARAALERAERDVERTELRAPYEGRVRSETIDVGQFVNRGASIAQLYAVDFAEVPLPIPDRELAYLDLDLGSRAAAPAAPSAPDTGGTGEADAPVDAAVGAGETGDSTEAAEASGGAPVVLRAEFAGRQQTWHGRVVRTEGEIDPRSRAVKVVVRVKQPYAEDPPLAVGLFVSAEILGRQIENAIVLPRAALREGRDGDQVMVVDDDDRIRFRTVEVLRAQRGQVVLGGGLAAGERVAISPLATAVEGMKVRVVADDNEPMDEAPK